jgi:hypothetical protein
MVLDQSFRHPVRSNKRHNLGVRIPGMDPWCQDCTVWRVWWEDGREVIKRIQQVDCSSGGSDRNNVSAIEVGEEIRDGEEPG